MNKIAVITIAASFAGTAAFADGHAQSPKDLAQGMVSALKDGGATLGNKIGGKGKGTASAVSGDGNGGWGNLGSTVLGTGQVSNRDGGRGTVPEPE